MAYCCSQCSFKAQFESALLMHHQLHHGSPIGHKDKTTVFKEKYSALRSPSLSPTSSPLMKHRGIKLPSRTSSATKLLGKLKARIYKSRTLFSHPETPEREVDLNNLSLASDCTSKALKMESVASLTHPALAGSMNLEERIEVFACHLCSFDADRITVLDRHLLNDHKIGLENLLKLVMAKTKDGLSEDTNPNLYGIRQPYYRQQNEMVQEGEFIIETVTPQIKILKHASTNTEHDSKVFSLEKNCEMISEEIERFLHDGKNYDSKDFLAKMQTLNECMCKFVNSSNTLKKVLTKEIGSKANVKEHYNAGEPFFNLVLGARETPRHWERARSEEMERGRVKYGEACRTGKPSSESFYF